VEHLPPLAFAPQLQAAGTAVVRALRRVGLRPPPSFEEVWSAYGSLGDADTRRAFFHTLHTVVDPGGQRPSATNRLYLLADMPTMIVWGDHDPIIPVKHAYATHEAIPGSVLHVFEDVGHFPQHDEPERFVRAVLAFVRSTKAARLSEDHMRDPINATVAG